jgi:hypothetical protein
MLTRGGDFGERRRESRSAARASAPQKLQCTIAATLGDVALRQERRSARVATARRLEDPHDGDALRARERRRAGAHN